MNYIKAFESHLRVHAKAEKTIQSYSGDTIGFLTYLESKELSFDGTLNRFTINSYKNHLIKENYEPTTINKKLNSIQSFNGFLIHEGIMTEKVVELGRDRIKIAKGWSFKNIMETKPSIYESNIQYIIQKFKKHWKGRLAAFKILLSDHISESCFRIFGRQFMQIKCTPNILFS